ncbi:hypothetical protein R1sor_000481 [Riccia sorocarpa]|uniref:Uncharacterized protein n=1 Tax=Riccia sorocarpa TaxID=122646 RepID=A0ABD3GZ83_9MARC
MNQEAKDERIRTVNSVVKTRLCEEGYRHLGDLTDASGEEIAGWEERKIHGIDSKNAERAYNALKETVLSWNSIRRVENGQIEQAFEEARNRRVVWEWKICGKLKSNPQNWPDDTNAVGCYVEENRQLRPRQKMLIPVSIDPLHPVGRSKWDKVERSFAERRSERKSQKRELPALEYSDYSHKYRAHKRMALPGATEIGSAPMM